MKVTGFTFIRNALIYDYPIREAILSVMPLCDEFIVAVGNSGLIVRKLGSLKRYGTIPFERTARCLL